MKYMLIAGESSGDLHASGLIRALRALDPEAKFRFFGGDLMAKEARCNPVVHYKQMNLMGFSAVLRQLPTIGRQLRKAREELRTFRPDVLILVDYPSFNLRVAQYAKKMGITVDFFISPKVWAWKEFRVKQIRRNVDQLFCILPFEPEWYRRKGYDKAVYVGNPSVEEIDKAIRHITPLRYFRERNGIEDKRPMIALLPGSRRSEIRANLPLMIEAAKRFPDFQYVVGAAPSIPERFYRDLAQDPGLQLVFNGTHTLLKYAEAALVTSGTATLETALVNTPQVVCYRSNGSSLFYGVMERVLNVKYVSLPNLVMGNSIVPELLLHRCTVDSIARELSALLQPSPRREWQLSGYKKMRARLGSTVAVEYAAEIIAKQLNLL